MDDLMKSLLLVFVIIYVVSPVDACPGPIDDVLVLLMTLAARKRLQQKNQYYGE